MNSSKGGYFLGSPITPRLVISAMILALPSEPTCRAVDVESSDLLPVPSQLEQAEAKRLIEEAFEDVLSDTSPAGARRAALTLLEYAQTESSPARRFVLFELATDLSAKGGDLAAAFDAIDGLAVQFDVHAVERKLSVLKTVASPVTQIHEQVIDYGQELIEDAVAEDDYETALEVCRLVESHVRKVPATARAVREQARRITVLQQQFESVRKAAATLANDANDPVANLEMGKFLCFHKGDWERGRHLLRKGSDLQLKALAEEDITFPVEAKRQKKVADGWWDLSEKQQQPTSRDALRHRAAHWYRLAVNELEGLEQRIAQNRIRQLEGTPAPANQDAKAKDVQARRRVDAQPPKGADPAVQAAIAKGLQFLWQNQQPWGHWDTQVRQNKNEADPAGQQHGGLTAIAMYALLLSGQDPSQNTTLRKTMTELSKLDLSGTYAVSFRMMALAAAPTPRDFRNTLAGDLRLLQAGMRKADGRFRYSLLEVPQIGDLSCTQHGWLAIAEAERMKLLRPNWQLIARSLVASQGADGGWSYATNNNQPRPPMTAAGLTILLLAKDRIVDAKLKRQVSDATIAGLNWLDKSFPQLDYPQRYYYLVGVQRVGMLSGRTHFNGIDWYQHGVQLLVKEQAADGSWNQDRRTPWRTISDTSFALIFLSRGDVGQIQEAKD